MPEIGGSSFFDKTDVTAIDIMILVNIRALTLMSRLFIPELGKQKKSFILNVSSIAAFKPMPFKTVYPASKAYVYSFSVGLGEELKNTPIHLSVLHPGPMDTSEENSGRIDKHGFLGKLVHFTVDEVAEIAINQVLAGEKVLYQGCLTRFVFDYSNSFPDE